MFARPVSAVSLVITKPMRHTTQRAMMAPCWSRWKVKPSTSAAGIAWFNLVPPVIRTCDVYRLGTLWLHDLDHSPRSTIIRHQARPCAWRNASGLEGAVIKYVLDHVVNGPTVGRVESAGCLAGLFTLCSGIDCIQTKKLTDTAHGNK